MRYQRQTILPDIGEIGQKHLGQAKVLVIGAGGLGHPVLQYLIGMGVGEIGIVDGDVVDESNLHRQVLFSKQDFGKNKAECLAHLFSARGESCVLKSYPFFLDKNSAFEIFPHYDVIVDGTDNFRTKFLINDVCCVLNKPMVFGSVSQFDGQVATFWKERGPCYRCLVPEIPKAKIQNCAEAGVIGSVPGIVGSMQALEVMKIIFLICGQESRLNPLIGKLMSFDLANNLFITHKLSVREKCKSHADEFQKESIEDNEAPVSWNTGSIGILLDVREKEEWEQFPMPLGTHWPLSQINAGVFPEHLKDKLIITACKSGVRAELACQILRANGFKTSFTKQNIANF